MFVMLPVSAHALDRSSGSTWARTTGASLSAWPENCWMSALGASRVVTKCHPPLVSFHRGASILELVTEASAFVVYKHSG